MRETLKDIGERVQVFFLSPFRTYTLLAILVIPFVIKLSSPLYDTDFIENILVEAHGMLFDVQLLGVLFAWLNQGGEKQRDIKRYREEIEDFLNWDSQEAAFRILGNIKRLNKHGVSDFNLTNAFFRDADLSDANLRGASLLGTNLVKANLGSVDLRDAKIAGANLSEAYLSEADFRGAKIGFVDLSGAYIIGADFRESNISKSLFQQAKYDKKLSGPKISIRLLQEQYS